MKTRNLLSAAIFKIVHATGIYSQLYKSKYAKTKYVLPLKSSAFILILFPKHTSDD